jgi:hypothetical protein
LDTAAAGEALTEVPMVARTPKARCVNCRTEFAVPDTYAHGDHIKCGTCGTKHKVSRGEALRLVLADVAPLQEALRGNEHLIERLQDELRSARGSLGLGANGIGLGVIYLLWQLALKDQPFSRGLAIEAAGIALGAGALLELANFLFFAKRHRITRLSEEIEAAKKESALIRQKLRDATRV